MSKKPTVLMILDGYGLNDTTKGNAVAIYLFCFLLFLFVFTCSR